MTDLWQAGQDALPFLRFVFLCQNLCGLIDFYQLPANKYTQIPKKFTFSDN